MPGLVSLLLADTEELELGGVLGDEELVDGVEEDVEGVEEMVEGVRDTEDRAEDAVEEVLLTLVW